MKIATFRERVFINLLTNMVPTLMDTGKKKTMPLYYVHVRKTRIKILAVLNIGHKNFHFLILGFISLLTNNLL